MADQCAVAAPDKRKRRAADGRVQRDKDVEDTVLDEDNMEDLEIGHLEAQLQEERRDLQDEMHRAKRNTDTPTLEMQADVEALLEAFGIPFLRAPSEAEAQCAYLAQARLVDAVATDDSDVFVFGAVEVYRRLFSEDKMVECYTARRIESRLGIRQPELVILSILLGCDYSPGVHGVGIVNGLEIVHAFSPAEDLRDKSLTGLHREAWLENLRGLRDWAQNVANWGHDEAGVEPGDGAAVAEFKKAHGRIRAQWSFPADFPSDEVLDAFQKASVDRSLEPFRWAPVDEPAVLARMVKMTEQGEQRIAERLGPAVKRYRSVLRQPRITEYMAPVSTGEVAVVQSERLRDALRGLRGEDQVLPAKKKKKKTVGRKATAERRPARRRGPPEEGTASAGWSLAEAPARIDLDLSD